MFFRKFDSLFSARRGPTWFRWRKSERRAESASGGDGLLANPRIVARRRFQSSGRRHRNRSGGFCCFSPSKSREKSFLELYAESLRGFRKIAVFTNFFFLYFWGQKYQKPPHVVFPGSVRATALHGARKIKPMRHPVTGAPQPAPSFSASNESADLLCRHRRHCLYMAMRPGSLYQLTFPEISIRQCVSLFSARRVPTWFRWRKSGRRAESASGGDGLLANPRIVARRRFQSSGRRQRNRSGGFCCFSPPKSREKSFFRRFFRKPKKDVERLFAAFRHRKAEKKERVFQAFFCKEQKDIGRLLATYTRKNNQQRILPCRKAPMPSICRASSHRAVRS